jgi:hypothetical protein
MFRKFDSRILLLALTIKVISFLLNIASLLIQKNTVIKYDKETKVIDNTQMEILSLVMNIETIKLYFSVFIMLLILTFAIQIKYK